MERLLDEGQVAELLGCSVQLLRKWRGTKEGPRHIKIGRCVRYVLDDVRSFVTARRVEVGGALALAEATETQ
jgi:predicted DNA-binding transcriptional regulator AlpA